MDNWKQYFRVRPGPPVTEDDFAINKRIIEGYCSYQSGMNGTASIRRLPAYLPDKIHVVSFNRKEALDFGSTIGKAIVHCSSTEALIGQKPDAVVFLGDFSRGAWNGTPRGHSEVEQYIKQLQSRSNFPIWHIAEWRFTHD